MEQYNEPMEPNMQTQIQEHVILELVAPLMMHEELIGE
jgi:hypothetical protein